MKQYALAYKLPLPRQRIVTNTCDANPLSNKFHILALNQLGSHGVHLIGGGKIWQEGTLHILPGYAIYLDMFAATSL